MLVFFFVAASLLVGWRYPGVLVPAVFFGFTVGAIGAWPSVTMLLVVLSIFMMTIRSLLTPAQLRVTGIDMAFCAFIAWCCISVAWQPNGHQAIQSAVSFASSTVSVYVLFRLVGGTGEFAERMNEIAAGFCLLALAVTPLALGAGSMIYGRLYVGESTPVGLSLPAPYVALSAVAIVMVWKNKLPAVLVFLAAASAAGALASATGARGALLASGAGLLTYVLLLGDSRSRLAIIGSLATVTVAAYFVATQMGGADAGVFGRLLDFSSYGSAQDLSSLARYDHYRFAWYLFEKNPVAGVGLGGYTALSGYMYPHNLFLEVLSKTGLVGFSLLMMLFVAVFFRARDLAGVDRKSAALLIAMLVVALVHQQVSFELAQAKGLFLIGLVAGVAVTGRDKARPAQSVATVGLGTH